MKRFATSVLWLAVFLLAGYSLTTSTWASDPQIDKLREQVRSVDFEQRLAAVRELSRQNSLEAFKAMLLAAYETDERLRFELERGLTSFTDPATLDWLGREGIVFPDKWVRFYCVDAFLQNRGAAGVPAVVDGLEKNYPEVQLLILERLSGSNLGRALSDEKVLEAVGRVLIPGQLPQIWLKALQVLEASNQPRGAEALAAALEEKAGWPPRPLASMIQGALARGQSPGLAERMRGALKTLKSPAARIGALMALGRSGEEAGLQTLLDFLKEEKDPELRAGAIGALGICPLIAAVKPLLDLAANTGAVPDALMAASALIDKPAGPEFESLKAAAADTATDFRLKGLLADLVRRVHAADGPGAPTAADNPEAPLVTPEALAARRALAWLVRNQEDDGHWSASKHNPYHLKHGFPNLYGEDADDYLDVAVTSWCLLALAADENHARGGPFAESVRRATQWLLAHQNPNGLFKSEKAPPTPTGGNPDFAVQSQHLWAMNHLSATLALIEASYQAIKSWKQTRSGDAKMPEDLAALDAAVEKAVDAITSKPLPDEYNFFNPKLVSLPRIALIATIRYAYLKRAAGLEAKERLFDKSVQKFTLDSLNKIAESATTVKVPFDRNGNYWFRSYGSSSQAICAAVYLTPDPPKIGTVNIFDFITQRMEMLRKHPPRWNPFYAIVGPTKHPPAGEPTAEESPVSSAYTRLGLTSAAWKDDVVNFEYWFWATDACFVVGEDEWFAWKELIQPVLFQHQSLAGASTGSWDPEGPNERVWGRCLSTAQGALMALMPRRVLQFHNVMWHRVIPKGSTVRPDPNAKKPDPTKDPNAGAKDADKTGEKGTEKKDDPMGKMDHPKKTEEEKK